MWIERSWFVRSGEPCSAGITQLAECQICNLNVVGANPTTGSREWCNGSTSDFN